MAQQYNDDVVTDMKVGFNVPAKDLWQVTPQEIILAESLLTPGLQTYVRVHSYAHSSPLKNLDDFKGCTVGIELTRKVLQQWGIPPIMSVQQTVYRVENRRPINNVTEEFSIHACDPTLLTDAATLVSKLWKCTTPSAVTADVLRNCAGATRLDIEGSMPARDYMAENIHPFQVVSQQKEAALAAGNDPSFLHYMTYQNFGTHHFRSLYSLTKAGPVMEYHNQETGIIDGYRDPHAMMTYNFPCDFDLLSDILNGIGPDGVDINSAVFVNPLLKQFGIFGNQAIGCGIGGAVLKAAMTNFMSAQQQNACPDYSQFYLQKRQARMGLLEQDKIALRLVVPWTTNLNVGKIIRVKIYSKEARGQLLYGSGDYLITHLTHNIKLNSLSTITMDCVSRTVGQGEV